MSALQSRLGSVVVLLLLGGAMVLALDRSANLHRGMSGRSGGEVLPAAVLRLTSLEFDGVAADLMQLRAMVAFGEMLEQKNPPTSGEWHWLQGTLRNAVELDRYFYDPYIFGNAILTWDAKMVKEANALLSRGVQARTWDYTLPFFLGFNHFYFLKDDARAADYLMESARRPGAPPLVAALATRLQYRRSRAETAAAFLQEILRQTEDPATRKDFEMRLVTLQQIVLLERLVAVYVANSGKQPKSLQELQQAGLIDHLPPDPYGGNYYLDADGSIKTTSDMRSAKRSDRDAQNP